MASELLAVGAQHVDDLAAAIGIGEPEDVLPAGSVMPGNVTGALNVKYVR